VTFEGAIGLAFATFVFAIIPGPGITAVVAQSLARGFSTAVFWTAGQVIGDLVYLLMAMFGMGWVAAQLGETFMVLKWFGAVYLIYLGIKCWLAEPPSGEAVLNRSVRGGMRCFAGGLCVSLGNPKVIAFYCGFLPGFVNMASLSAMDIVLVVAITIPVIFLVPVAYAWLAARGRKAVRSTRIWKIANRSAGAVMIGAGAAVVTE